MTWLQSLDSRLAFIGSLLVAVLVFGAPASIAAGPAPAGRAVIARHVTISPAWFDPSTAPPQITPFGMLYAIHDALVRPYPGQRMGPSLAASWQESEDGLTYEFKLRSGLKFHNGDPVTAEDVRFSFERYASTGATALKEHVREVEIIDPLVVRFHLKEPWPDFMTFYGTPASAAGIVVPKNYLTQIGDDGFKKQPIGAGPYKFVSNKPGVEVELEAFPGYWRRVPNVKTLVMRGCWVGRCGGIEKTSLISLTSEERRAGPHMGVRWRARRCRQCPRHRSPTLPDARQLRYRHPASWERENDNC